MKLFYLIGFFVSISAVIAANWSPEDYEIFKLNDKLESDIGQGTTFYSWLNLPNGPRSTLEEINKAYRKISRKLHPDKFHSAKKSAKKLAEERFQRLSAIGNILRDKNLKNRYDYFLKNGFPKWKGSGYFYSRFRPGMIMTLGFLFCVIGLFHYVALKINRNQDYKRIVALKNEIVKNAWNGSLPPADGSDRVIRHSGNGKDFLVNVAGEVSLMEKDDKGSPILHPLDENDIDTDLGFTDTLFYKFPVWLYNKSIGRVTGEIKPIVKAPKVRESKPEQNDTKPKKKSKNKGEKIELPNGKVIYGRKRK